jgi:hypothetical protein
MKLKVVRRNSTLVTKALAGACLALIGCEASAAVFQGWEVPIQVRTAWCDSNPRIFVEFADSSKNIWYPANSGDSSKFFLSTALAAKVSGQKMYFLGSDETVTSYCITSGKLVQIFGVSDG